MLYYTTTTKRRRKDDKQRKHGTETPNQNINRNTPQPKRGIQASNKDRTNNRNGGNNKENLQQITKQIEAKKEQTLRAKAKI